jgi:outer membrane receptor protein involved in Fe transport
VWPLVMPAAAYAQESSRLEVELTEQALAASLSALAVLFGRTVLAEDEVVAQHRAAALQGAFTLEEALDQLLVGTGLAAEPTGNGFVVRVAQASARRGRGSDIVVTGTQIRGGRLASTLIVLDQQRLRDSGYADLGEIARSLPQSFGGGQNPALGLNVPQSIGANISGGSTVNLRGLGSDATLTILNGRRMPYDGAFQGVDISAIPISAVERMEVVADGASAIYGSDAVGGVVNVILRSDFEGLLTRARLGGATKGGNFQQLYSATTGAKWRGGGGFLAYELNDNTELNSSDRTSTRIRPNLTLVPESRRHAVVGHLHQDLTERLSLEFDGLYNNRNLALTYPINQAADLSISRTEQSAKSYSYALAGAAHLDLGDWRASLTATLGKGRNRVRADSFYNDVLGVSFANRYDNRTTTAELSAEGPLVALPAGAVRLATGLGLRDNGFVNFRGAGNVSNVDLTQRSRYVFGELSIPLVSPDLQVPFVHRLDLSAAGRYEHYRGIDRIATPKLGIIYAPSDVFDLRASWGRSFRAPSFYDQYGVQQAQLYPVSRLGGQGYAAGATALYISGGNRDVKPERARSWSATLALHPPALAGASLELSYFSTDYVDRIVTPILLASQSLSNPAYARLITYNPGQAQLAAALAEADVFTNTTATPYDPARVVALVDARNLNAGRQRIRGLDIQARYRGAVGGGMASFDLGASYLKSRQRLSASAPEEVLAGRLFNPPHWRGRAGVTWAANGLRLTATGNHIGGVIDTRVAGANASRGMTTLDLGARYGFEAETGVLHGLEVGLTATNVLDAMPPTIATTLYYETPYDSTNYSAVGRFVALEVTKSW